MSKIGKKSYKRSTPVGRLRRNTGKISRHAILMQVRLNSWGNGVSDKREIMARVIVGEILDEVSRLDGVMESLEESGFAPPRRSSALRYVIGQHVAIGPKHVDKYGLVFEKILREDPAMLDDLIVSNILPSGEVVVQRGQRTPFLVPKSHLVFLRNKDAAKR